MRCAGIQMPLASLLAKSSVDPQCPHGGSVAGDGVVDSDLDPLSIFLLVSMLVPAVSEDSERWHVLEHQRRFVSAADLVCGWQAHIAGGALKVYCSDMMVTRGMRQNCGMYWKMLSQDLERWNSCCCHLIQGLHIVR